ncbi:MAG: DivIVA domain-containing protein [Erysipelotrichaceae bacterium]|nr:DivIVA domain-containing protein [Erysipelotrichaceae bacterium]MDY5252481.1 DivIVA domain-containing protein [Erysipelotrichaceae bacterium]
MTNKLNLDIHTILDTQFNIDFKGYSPKDVDAFLDLVMEDYETYQNISAQLNERVSELERTNASLRAKLIELEAKARSYEESSSANISNVDILKRISRLEQEVYGNKR